MTFSLIFVGALGKNKNKHILTSRVAEPYYFGAAPAPEPFIFIAAPASSYIILHTNIHVFAKGT